MAPLIKTRSIKARVKPKGLLVGDIAPQRATGLLTLVRITGPRGGKGEIGTVEILPDGKIRFRPDKLSHRARIIAKSTRVALLKPDPDARGLTPLPKGGDRR